jgi:hypothetical protein
MEENIDYEMLSSGEPAENIWPFFEKLPIMTASEIGEELGQSRQNISQMLKRIFEKLYHEVRKDDPNMSPFKTAIFISKLLGIDYTAEMEVKKFFGLFPPSIRTLIKEDAEGSLQAGKRRILSTLL